MSRVKPENGKLIFKALPGVSFVECLILMVVLAITMGAIFTAMQWGSKSYAFAKEDIERRLLIFNWCQAFESFYPGVTSDVKDAFARTTRFLGGSWDSVGGVASFKEGRIVISDHTSVPGIVSVRLRAHTDYGAAGFVLERRFNAFSSETVSDDVY
jgi:hypothetical protein